LYAARLIPPVPLSVQYQGVFHNVERHGRDYVLTAERPPFYRFWRTDSRPFHFRPGDRVCYFARIFAPNRFKGTVMIRWEFFDLGAKSYRTTDVIPLPISGGRGEGFRGWAAKGNFSPGRWRVSVETDTGRTIGTLAFRVVPAAGNAALEWRQTRM
jgi:hypothetical protein